MRRAAMLLVLLAAAPAWGQTVKLPAEVKVDAGRLAAVKLEYDGDDVRWDVPSGLDCFREYDPDAKVVRLRLIGYAAGEYRLLAVAAKGGRLSDFGVCKVIVGGPSPPGPGPLPPGPGPQPPDPPAPPAPIPGDGLRVLIVYESADLSKMPPAQQAVLYAASVRSYLNGKCPVGPDGKTRDWRIFDADIALDGETPLWQDAMKRPRKSVPWIIISTGKSGYEGPLPESVDKTLELLKKYGGA